jgi:hypothetical protein
MQCLQIAGALIKKCRFWPTLVQGDVINQHFVTKNIGDTDAVQGELNGT